MPSSHLILCHPLFRQPPIPPSIRSFPMSQHFAWGGQSTGVSALASSFQRNPRADLLQNGLVGSPCTPRDSQESSPVNLDSKLCFIQPDFLIMYSVYKLNKWADSIQPWCVPFPMWNQSIVPFQVLTVASWTAYKFLRRKVWWSGISIILSVFHRLLWSTQSKVLV